MARQLVSTLQGVLNEKDYFILIIIHVVPWQFTTRTAKLKLCKVKLFVEVRGSIPDVTNGTKSNVRLIELNHKIQFD